MDAKIHYTVGEMCDFIHERLFRCEINMGEKHAVYCNGIKGEDPNCVFEFEIVNRIEEMNKNNKLILDSLK